MSNKSQKHKRPSTKKAKRPEKETTLLDQDEYFYYIAGYTPGGAPYGITWKQASKDGLLDDSDEEADETDIEIF